MRKVYFSSLVVDNLKNSNYCLDLYKINIIIIGIDIYNISIYIGIDLDNVLYYSLIILTAIYIERRGSYI